MHKVLVLWLCVMGSWEVRAQEPENPVDRVYQMLIAPPYPIEGSVISLLENGPWEALAYLDPGRIPETHATQGPPGDLLQEAVPDLYHFSGGMLRLEPFSGANSKGESRPIEVYYTLVERALVLASTPNGPERDRWTIHYLNAHYLVLDMGDLRLFLTHP
ncbi:hypothetical protein GC167_08870 [bacterium]|nr:hypothetical protein [bacterium]